MSFEFSAIQSFIFVKYYKITFCKILALLKLIINKKKLLKKIMDAIFDFLKINPM